jgi:hypothetical protein
MVGRLSASVSTFSLFSGCIFLSEWSIGASYGLNENFQVGAICIMRIYYHQHRIAFIAIKNHI